ncbi:trigger factor [Candidatus Falkowbacteria bacterium CG10_big_fil_rev_8_21_14_0_10_37_6]|uniref:Trigger factor n=1 Tax=Candidatus Falkowbacteria bacterium CG10_big_fil_rev_8_21_14_0_10_37_6 TaxID=1974563 RepID=A0A2H0V912_9BACT|nr:MAG: trigger factor [Candidatus Falkowbacteria bacterium CG10_big_fil_rev_8_21_14_0_10_37_6]
MNVNKNNNNKELEITIELAWEELKPYLNKASEKISQDVKVEGFRPGKAPYDVLKKKVGEMTILQEAANIAIQKTADSIIKEQIKGDEDKIIGRPEVKLTKVAVDNPLEYKIIMQLIPEITLGKYKGLGIKAKQTQIQKEEVEKVIKDLRDMRASEKITTREIKSDDKVIVNMQMFLDNVPIEGGQSKDTTVMIGADYIIPGFDKHLLGAKKGDIREFKLPYPESHYQKNLAGKMVEFKVEIKEVYERQLPELNEEFVKNLGAASVEDLNKKITENMEMEARQKDEQKVVIEIFEKLLAAAKFSHLSEQLVHSESHNMIHELKHNVEQQGAKFEDYLMHMKKTEQELEKDFAPEAEKRVKTSFIIDKILREENIKVSDEELQAEVDERLKMYESNPEMKKQADTSEFRNYLRYNMLNKKVIDKLKEWNIAN